MCSRSKTFVLGLVLAAAWSTSGVVAQFEDHFEDGDVDDCDPTCWTLRCGFAGSTHVDVIERDLVIGLEGSLGFAEGVLLSSVIFTREISVRTRVALETALSVGLAVHASPCSAMYLGGVNSEKVLWLNESEDTLQETQVPEIALDADVLLQLDVVGETVSLRVWNAAEAMPVEPQIQLKHEGLQGGRIGLVVFGDPEADLSQAVFRHIEVSGQFDCNGDGIPNGDDSEDCNGNGVPDECEVAGATNDAVSDGKPVDCNGNGLPDLCEVLDGVSPDCNDNLTPDDCEVPLEGADGCPYLRNSVLGLPAINDPRVGSTTSRDGCLDFVGSAGDLSRNRVRFSHQAVTGDFRLTAQVRDWPTDELADVGLMVRESLAPPARYAAVFLHSDDRFQHRFLARADLVNQWPTVTRHDTYDTASAWLRIERRGAEISGMLSLDGENWSEPDTAVFTPDLPDEVHIGIASAFETNGPHNPAVICDLSVVPLPPGPDFLRGDCDGDGDACSGVHDALLLLNWLFLGRSAPPCLAACDPDGSGELALEDAVYGLNYCFNATDAPVAPFPNCGPGTEKDGVLGCVGSACE